MTVKKFIYRFISAALAVVMLLCTAAQSRSFADEGSDTSGETGTVTGSGEAGEPSSGPDSDTGDAGGSADAPDTAPDSGSDDASGADGEDAAEGETDDLPEVEADSRYALYPEVQTMDLSPYLRKGIINGRSFGAAAKKLVGKDIRDFVIRYEFGDDALTGEDYDSYVQLTQGLYENTSAIFVYEAASSLGLVGSHSFPHESTAGGLFAYLAADTANTVINIRSTAVYGGSKQISVGDLLFYAPQDESGGTDGLESAVRYLLKALENEEPELSPAGLGLNELYALYDYSMVGIVTGVSTGSITLAFGDGDTVSSVTYSYDDFASLPELSDCRLVRVTFRNLEQHIFELLVRDYGFNVSAACGIMANISHESRFDTRAVGDDGTSFGLMQWHNERADALFAFADAMDADPYDADVQIAFFVDELNTNEKFASLKDSLALAKKLPGYAFYDAYLFCLEFEQPYDAERKALIRGRIAEEYLYSYYAYYTIPG